MSTIKPLIVMMTLAAVLLSGGCDKAKESSPPAEPSKIEVDRAPARTKVRKNTKSQPAPIPTTKPATKPSVKVKVEPKEVRKSLADGLTEAEFIAIAGPPTGEVLAGGKKFLSYDGVLITVTDGRVKEIPPAFEQAVKKARETLEQERLEYKKFRDKGLVQYNGKWVTPEERDRRILIARNAQKQPAAKEKKKAAGGKKITGKKYKTGHIVKNSKGKPVDHSSMVRSGHVTVVLFYTNRRGASGTGYRRFDKGKVLAYDIYHMIRDQKGVHMKRINVDTLDTPVAKQYGVSNLPEVRVFGKDTKMIGTPSKSYDTITGYIEFGKKSK